MVEWSRSIRLLVCDLAIALVCVWTGYFATHTWKTADAAQVSLLCVGTALCVAGVEGVFLLRRGGGKFAAAWCSAGIAAIGTVLTALAVLRAAFAVGILLFVMLVRSRLAWRSAGARFLFGFWFALAAASVGFVAVFPVSVQTSWLILTLAIYVALTEAARGEPPVSRAGFGALLALMIAMVLVVGAVALGRPHGLLGAALALWLVLRLGVLGARVVGRHAPGRVASFVEQVQLGVGLMAGALLTLAIDGAAGLSASAELAWAIAAGAFSFLLMRLWPLVAGRGEE